MWSTRPGWPRKSCQASASSGAASSSCAATSCRGLTTAASVWLTSALGMACGAGLPVLAIATTAGYFLIMFVYPKLVMHFLPHDRRASTRLRVGYEDRMGLLSSILVTCSELHFAIEHVDVERARTEAVVREVAQDLADAEGSEIEMPQEGSVILTLLVSGEQPFCSSDCAAERDQWRGSCRQPGG